MSQVHQLSLDRLQYHQDHIRGGFLNRMLPCDDLGLCLLRLEVLTSDYVATVRACCKQIAIEQIVPTAHGAWELFQRRQQNWAQSKKRIRQTGIVNILGV